MSELSPCPACNRHVRIADPSCPFCAAPLPERASAAGRLPRGRLSRAAIFTAGATLAGMAACTNTSNNAADGGAGGKGGGDGGVSSDASGAGGSGGSTGGSGGSTGAGGRAGAGGSAGAGGRGGADAGTNDGPVAIYSAAFPPNLGQT